MARDLSCATRSSRRRAPDMTPRAVGQTKGHVQKPATRSRSSSSSVSGSSCKAAMSSPWQGEAYRQDGPHTGSPHSRDPSPHSGTDSGSDMSARETTDTSIVVRLDQVSPDLSTVPGEIWARRGIRTCEGRAGRPDRAQLPVHTS